MLVQCPLGNYATDEGQLRVFLHDPPTALLQVRVLIKGYKLMGALCKLNTPRKLPASSGGGGDAAPAAAAASVPGPSKEFQELVSQVHRFTPVIYNFIYDTTNEVCIRWLAWPRRACHTSAACTLATTPTPLQAVQPTKTAPA